MGRESDLIEEAFDVLNSGLVEWQASEYPQLVPVTTGGLNDVDLVSAPSLQYPGKHVVFSFFCPLEKAANSPAMQCVPAVKFALLKDEATAYRFWLHGYSAYTDIPSCEPHGLLLLMNPRIPDDGESKPTICMHCYLAEIRQRWDSEGRGDELDKALRPLSKPDLKGGIVFDVASL